VPDVALWLGLGLMSKLVSVKMIDGVRVGWMDLGIILICSRAFNLFSSYNLHVYDLYIQL